MIAYHGPYNSRLGGAQFLGQDAVIQPVAAAPAAPPTPEPFGSGLPGGPTPPPTGPTPAPAPTVTPPPAAVAPSNGWMVTLGGKTISGWTLVLSGMVFVGGVALVVYTKEEVDLSYKTKRKSK